LYVQLLYFRCNPAWHIAAHHYKIFSSFFYTCILRSTIGFAELRKRSWRRGAEWNTLRSIYANLSKFN
ncbi:MAG: hypothetical protein KAT65_26655, partial [Methanophagales archaeon]|nr:hypothetical protein [Methanophagales archaeon]